MQIAFGVQLMDNWKYHKDYSEYWDSNEDEGNLEECEISLLQALDKRINHSPRLLNLHGKRAFDTMLLKCESYAKDNGGIVDAAIDSSNFEARIFLEAPYFEFANTEERELLQAAAELSHSLYFCPMENGWINMSMTFLCFVSL